MRTIDRHIAGIDTGVYYREVSRVLNSLSVGGIFAPVFDVIRKLSALLENKADFGVRLKAAYDRGDREMLADMVRECDEIREKLQALRESHRSSWMFCNKPFGWEVHDIRYGGLLMRFDTAKQCILAFLAGEISCIEELEEERLRCDAASDMAPPFGDRFLWKRYISIATPGIQ